MSAINKTYVKTILQIASADTSRDTLIETLIPTVIGNLFADLHRDFKDLLVYHSTSTVSFTAAPSPKIDDAEGDFEGDGFLAGMEVWIEGSQLNDGYRVISSVAETQITLTAVGLETVEPVGYAVTITKIAIPFDLKPWIARMIGVEIDKTQMAGIKSKSLSDMSVTFADTSYPPAMVKALNSYRKLSWP
jgi:hypothetical protein